MNTTAKGSCYCQAVKFTIKLPVDDVLHCHCNMCRRLSGSDYTTWVIVPKSNFSIISGKNKLNTYPVSDHCTQTFCNICGTRITTTDTKYDHVFGILRGIINDDIKKTTSAEYYVTDKASWNHLTSTLPQYGGENGTEPLFETRD